MAEGFTLDVSLNFDKAIRQMAEFQKKHGTVELAPGQKAGAQGGGASSGNGSEDTRKLAQTVRLTTQLFRNLNSALSGFTASIQKAGAGAARAAMPVNAAPAAATAGGLASVGKAGAFAMQIPGWAMMAQMAGAPAAKIWQTGMGFINRARTQAKSELSLRGVLGNAGLGAAEFETLKQSAAELQGRTIYGDEALLNASGELATFIKDRNGRVSMGNLQRMMSVLTDYASGMGNNRAMSPEELTNLATGLGQAFDGNYRAMRLKGFDTSELEALQERAKNGENVAPEEKVAAIERALSDWTGRAEAFARTGEGREIQMRNRLGDTEETIGQRITPAYERLTATIMQAEPTLTRLKETMGDLFVGVAENLAQSIPELSKSLKFAADITSDFAKNADMVGNTLRTAGGAMAMIIGLKFGAAMQGLASQMKLAVLETNSFRQSLNILGKNAIVQGGLFVACSWALGKIGQAAKLLLELAGIEGDNSARESELRMFQENKSWETAYAKDMKAQEKGMTNAELEQVKRLPGLPFNPDNPQSFDMRSLPSGLNAKQIAYLKAKGGRDYFRGKASESMKRMNAVGSGSGDDRADYDKAVQDAIAMGGKLDMNITNNNTNVKQENHIEAGFDEIGKLIRENLQEILVSRLNFRADVESVKAVAL